MKNIFTIFIFAVYLIIFSSRVYSSSITIDSGRAGNGGGGLKLEDRYYTFEELDLLISENNSLLYQLDPKTVNILDEILIVNENLGLTTSVRNQILNSILNLNVKYIKTKLDIENTRFKKEDYKRIYGHNNLFKNNQFVLYADTGKEPHTKFITKLYSHYFKLSYTQRAIILIHEALFRFNPNAELEDILLAGVEIYKLSHGKSESPVMLFNALKKIKILNLSSIVTHFINYYKKQEYTDIPLNYLASSISKIEYISDSNLKKYYFLSFDSFKLMDLENKYQGISQLLEDITIMVSNNPENCSVEYLESDRYKCTDEHDLEKNIYLVRHTLKIMNNKLHIFYKNGEEKVLRKVTFITNDQKSNYLIDPLYIVEQFSIY